MIVVDTSALAKYVLKEENEIEVRKALEEDAVSVDHVVKEVVNTVWKRTVVLKLEPLDIALKRSQILKRLVTDGVVRLENELKYIDTAFRIALENGIPIYDALYIA